MSSRPWMPLYIGDYRRDTAHLSTLEHGAYMLLIMHYWETGPLPADRARLARIAGLTVKRFNPVWVSLRGFFTEANAEQLLSKCFRHRRIDEELKRCDEITTKRKIAGQKGGLASRGKTNLDRWQVKQLLSKGATNHSHIYPPYEPPQPAERPEGVAAEMVAAKPSSPLAPSSELVAIMAKKAKGWK